ncbi:MAG: 50S ribosomal protein L29 [Candidatus Pacebacteria bacterium]|jgi:ribosomal protein L29|nr:50S ribosomal protein L29 [Candidatus Paceibacterota bacterium]
MKKLNFKDMKDTELVKALTEKRDALRAFRFAASGAKSKNVKQGSLLKKEIARILTVLSSKNK